MSQHIEWVEADRGAELLDEAEIEEYSPDGNTESHVGVWVGDYDGAIIYGTKESVRAWAEDLLRQLKREGWEE